jgi:SHS2 domain-containing protein
MRATTPRGHRNLPHTADVIIEAWGPDLAACAEEAVAALIETYANARDTAVLAEREVHVPPASADEMLLDLLDEVVFAVDVADGIPIGARVHASSDGNAGLHAQLALADPASVEPAGAVPKAISRSGLEVTRDPDAVRCRFLVDV